MAGSKVGASRKKTGGRVAGTPNKLTRDIKEMIGAALAKGGFQDRKAGVAWLRKQMDENPVAFMTLVGKLMPLQVNQRNSYDLSGLSDEELDQLVRLGDRLRVVSPSEGGEGETRH